MSAETVVHPSAVIDPQAELDEGVQIGPYVVIGPHVRIGKNTRVGPHAVVEGRTTIGRENQIFQFASVGAVPQDQKYHSEDSTLTIGNRNIIREFATLNPGTRGGGMATVVGDDNFFMVSSHVAHDCRVGNSVILANCATLAGHVVLEDHVIVGGLVGVHQYARIGESAFLAAGAMVSMDVPPYCAASGDRARVTGLNLVGLKRRGFGHDQIRAIKQAYRTVFAGGLALRDALESLRQENVNVPEVRRLVEFIARSQRGICRPRGQATADDKQQGF